MKDFINPKYQTVLSANQLDFFEALWRLECDWFEPPNKRRGGWSGVVKITLEDFEGRGQDFFLKRQENHCYRTLNGFRKVPTFRREFENIRRFCAYGFPTLDLVYYAERFINKKKRAILMTKSISPEFVSLEEYLQKWKTQGFPNKNDYRNIMVEVAQVIRQFHRRFLKHNALFAKHIFLYYRPGEAPRVKLIDLEKMNYWFSRKKIMAIDLVSLAKTVFPYLPTSDLRYFYRCYCQSPFYLKQKNLLRSILVRLKRKLGQTKKINNL